jgi:Xaa-Pro aminopeptidase
MSENLPLIHPSMKVRPNLAFPPAEYCDRLTRVRRTMAAQEMDGLILHSPENICYLSGFHTPGYYWLQFLVIPLEGDPVLVVRSLERWSVNVCSWLDPDNTVAYADTEDPISALLGVCRRLRLEHARIGLEMDSFFLPNSRYEDLKRALAAATLINGSGITELERAIKSPAEIAYIRAACCISEIGIAAAAAHCRAGMTENALAGYIQQAMTEVGAEYPGLPLFLSSGHRSLVAHATASDKVIEKGDNVWVELTGVVHRYAGPLFRTLFLGEPPQAVRARMAILNEMLAAVIAAMRPGTTTREVNSAAVQAAARHGLAVGVRKRAGYSVGLNFPPDWGEGHFLDLRDSGTTVLAPGMVFHVPQTLRLEGEMPLAISETVLIGESGPEILTNFKPRDLVVV